MFIIFGKNPAKAATQKLASPALMSSSIEVVFQRGDVQCATRECESSLMLTYTKWPRSVKQQVNIVNIASVGL